VLRPGIQEAVRVLPADAGKGEEVDRPLLEGSDIDAPNRGRAALAAGRQMSSNVSAGQRTLTHRVLH